MSDRFHTHETVAWAKQRLDDLDAIISEVEKTSDKLKDSARREVDAVLVRLKTSRDTIQKIYDDLRDEAKSVKGSVEGIQDALEAEWVEVESVFQTYLAAVSDRAESTRDVVARTGSAPVLGGVSQSVA